MPRPLWTPTRRRLLQGMGLGAAAGLGLPWGLRRARAEVEGPRYLVVLGCFGGASMVDCFMPVDPGEALSLEDRGTVNSYDWLQPEGSRIRCVDRSEPYAFLSAHMDHMVVMGTQSSSVNHWTAQARWMTGRDMVSGRTMAEIMAAAYGGTMPLPNVNMGRGGYGTGGQDPGLDPRYVAETVVNPVTFPLSTHGHLGLLPVGEAPLYDPELRAAFVAHARAFRDEQLEQQTPFAKTFANSRLRRTLLQARRTTEVDVELADLIDELFFVPDLGDILPLEEYGLRGNEEAEAIMDALPRALPTDTSGNAQDRLQAQAALAYLLIRTNSAAAVTLTEPGTDGFLAFDLSHRGHRDAQATHWDRVLDVADRLIGLLATAPYRDSEGAEDGTSLWDRTMIVFSTEFGRDKWDTGSGYGTGHHLNNGLLAVSPLLRGNQSLGLVDPDNGFICGWDPETGEATPFDDLVPGEDPLYTDERLPPGEDEVCGALLHVLGVEFEGQVTMPVLEPEV